MTAHLVIIDRFGKKVLTTIVNPSNMHRAAYKFSDMYPECWISLTPSDKHSDEMYSLCPKLMKRDEDRMANDDMSFEEYHEYWYPVSSNKIQEALYQELKRAEAELPIPEEEESLEN